MRLRDLAGVIALVAACSGGSTPPAGKTCLMNSECQSPLVCTYGRCHTACAEARDCPTGELCVKGMGGSVCQLPVEARCTSGAQCGNPLVCGGDGVCRSDCSADNACPTPTQKCVMPDRICAEPEELDPASGLLKNARPAADGGAPADGSSDLAPAGSCTDHQKNGSETDTDCGGSCPACALGKSCGAAGDCASGQCLTNKCLECAPGTTRCAGKKQATCMGGIWVTPNNDCEQGCDGTTGACRMCPASTCRSVKVIFHGAVEGHPDIQLAVDDGKVYKTSADTDPMIGMKNTLFGNFTDDRKQYTTDNVACTLPDFARRTNVYYLAPVDSLNVASRWYTSPDDFKIEVYGQSCPNYGTNDISTPKRIDKIEILAASGDLTCKVCWYKEGAPPSDQTLVRCVPPNTTLSGPDLAPMTAPAILQLDDGKRCGSY